MIQRVGDCFHRLAEWLVLSGSFLVQKLLYQSQLPKKFAPKKILVIKLDHFGDLLISTAVFNNLHVNFPTATIDVLIGHWGKTVLENHPYIHQLFFYNSPFFSRHAKASSFWSAIRIMFRLWRKYDLVVDLRGDSLTVVMALLKSTPYRIDRACYQIEQKMNGTSSDNRHEIDRNLDLLKKQKLQIPSRIPSFYPSLVDQDWADIYCANLPSNRPLVVIHPGSPVELKRWPEKSFAELSEWLIEFYQATVVLIGDISEKKLVESIQNFTSKKTISLVGQTNFGQLGALLKNTKLFIGNDSAPMHLAAMMGTSVVALYGPSDPKRFGPLGIDSYIIRTKSDCPPCMSTYCKLDGLGCMRDISLADVQKAVALLL